MSDKREEQREKLLQAAYDLVADVGVSGLRTRDIAERAGVNSATLHYCFAGKDALLQALYEFIISKFKHEFDGRLGKAETAADKLRAHASLRVQFLHDQPKPVKVWRGFTSEAWTNPTIAAILRRHLAESREKMTAIIADARRSGALTCLPTADDRLAASMVIALFDGLMFQYTMDPEAFSAPDYSDAVLAWLGVSTNDLQPTK